MSKPKSAIRFLGIVSMAACLFARSPKTGWNGLRRGASNRFFTIATRDGSCLTGKILAVSDAAIVVQDWPSLAGDSGGQTFARSALLRISAGGSSAVRDIVFSGRSSWFDVQRARTVDDEHLLVVTADGKKLRGSFQGATGDSLTLIESSAQLTVAKENVARVYFLWSKTPLREIGRPRIERLIFDPLALRGRDPFLVLLYDSSVVENNAPVDCDGAMRRFNPEAGR